MTTNTEALRRAFEGYVNPDADIDLRWQAAGYYAGRNIQTSWLDFQAGHAAAKAETAAAVAKERERAATVVDEKIGSVCKANPGRGGRINSAVAFVLDALRDCADAIRAGAKETIDG